MDIELNSSITLYSGCAQVIHFICLSPLTYAHDKRRERIAAISEQIVIKRSKVRKTMQGGRAGEHKVRRYADVLGHRYLQSTARTTLLSKLDE